MPSAMTDSSALLSELQAVLGTAASAQQQETDEGPSWAAWSSAMEGYYAAATQLKYLLDLQLDKQSLLADVCRDLLRLYEQRVEVLKGKLGAAEGAQWVQLDAAVTHELEGGCNRESAITNTAPAHCQNNCQCSTQTCHKQGMPQAVMTGVAGGLRSCGNEGHVEAADHSTAATALNELLQMCQRTVAGCLDDVVGLEDVKQELEESVFLPQQHPYLFKGLRQPARSFLLYGPPGTGKTMLVEKVAAEADFTLLAISPSMILSKWAGDSEKAIRHLFDLAQTMQPSILFLDEVDSIGQSRDSHTDAGSRRLLTELLIQFNKIADEENVYVFGATNRIQDCDPALLRRFQRRVPVPLPGEPERLAFFQAVLSRAELASNLTLEDMQQLARSTEGYSGSDLTAVCRLAAMAPVKEVFQQEREHGACRKRRRLASCQSETSSAPMTMQCSQQGGACSADGSLSHCSIADGAGGNDDGSTAGATGGGCSKLQLRLLTLADFQAALSRTKPALVDAAAAAATV